MTISKSHKQLPGPANYNITKNFGHDTYSYSIGKGPRGTSARTGGPGPGNYDIPAKFAKDAPKITISMHRPNSANPNSVPGPGTYESHLKNRTRSPTYRIGSAKRDYDPINREKSKVPASNTYNPKINDRYTQPKWGLYSK